MNKIIITLIVSIIILAGVSVIMWQKGQLDQLKQSGASVEVTNTQNPTKSIVKEQQLVSVSDEFIYTNQSYGFSLVFPKNWGMVTEELRKDIPTGAKINTVIRLTSQKDAERWLDIIIAKAEDKNHATVVDYPAVDVITSSMWHFKYSGSGSYAGMPGMDDPKYRTMQKEAEDIMKTFKLLGGSQGVVQNSADNTKLNKSSAPVTEPMSEWQVYHNRELGFEIKFPNNWRYIDIDNGAMFGPKEIREDTIMGIVALNRMPRVGDTKPNSEVTRVEDLTFGHLPAKRVYTKNIRMGKESSAIIVQHNGDIISIGEATLNNSDYPFPSKFNDTVNKMIATFRFVE